MNHVTWEQIVDYVSGDGDGDEIDEHLMGCAVCTAMAESALRIARAIHGAVPPIVSAEQVAAMRAAGLVVDDNTFAPGTRTEVAFKQGVDILLHHLAGLDLANAERVHVRVSVESTGEVLSDDYFAPFDATRGEVLIACQRHFATLPPDIQFDVHVHKPAAAPIVATYRIPHVFAN